MSIYLLDTALAVAGNSCAQPARRPARLGGPLRKAGEKAHLSARTDSGYKGCSISRHQPCSLPTDMMMKSISFSLAAFALATLPGVALGQRAGASTYIDDRLSQIARSIADLQSRAEQLQKQNQQLQLQLDKMRTSYESRLERLEKGGAARAPAPHAGQPRR